MCISMDGASGIRLILSRIARSILIAASMVLRWVSQCVCGAVLRFERGSAMFFHLRVISSEMSVCMFTMCFTSFLLDPSHLIPSDPCATNANV